MFKKPLKLKVHILPAKEDDMHMGWVRLSDDLRGEIANGSYVQIEANKKVINCQIRGTPGKLGRLEINEWYRNKLGWETPPNEAEIVVTKTGIAGRFKALMQHPDDIVRIGIGLGVLGLGLGLLAIIISVLPPSITVMAVGDNIGLIGLVFALLLIPIVIFLLCMGTAMFLNIGHK
jgi:hypothetical protein